MSKQTVEQKLANVEIKLRRWETKLTRAVNETNKLSKLRRRYQLELLQPKDAKPVVVVKVKNGKVTAVEPPPAIETDHISEVDLPDFLNRADPLIAEKMTAARKAAEAEARTKMPLTGKAALQFIKKDGKKGKARPR